MPTPTHVFAELAATHGHVDPADLAAVQRWYEEVLPGLPSATVEQVMDELASREGEVPQAPALERSYPAGAPLPSLAQSKPARLPMLATRWRDVLKRFRRAD